MKYSDKKDILQTELKVVNIGAEIFRDALKEQGVEVVQIDWSPPAGGDQELARLLEKLG